jgi:hypothetical protein
VLGESNGTGEKVPSGLGKGLPERWRAARRYERNGKSRAWKPGITECELDFASKTTSPSIDERDSVAAVLGQVALGITDDEHIGKQHESYEPK